MTVNERVQIVNIHERTKFSPHARVNQELLVSNELVTRMNCYEPGQITPMHTHPHEDEVLYVIEIQAADVRGKTLIHTTHAGTQGLVNASSATHVLTGAFVNASATVRYVRSIAPQTVTLVRMGLQAQCNSDEDDLCAEYLRCLLSEEAFDTAAIKPTLRASPFSARFFDPQQPWAPRSDFDFCLDVDRFDFALRATRIGDGELSLAQVQL